MHRHRFRTRAEARLKIATWFADFCNAHRRHSAADGLPPIVYEQQVMAARTVTRARLREAIAA
ncbi:hypothetical protein CA984_10355 [Streptosporangium minutum]|uniref:Integrase catalytic domain-containing protein n=1 Tax=Streptosporangium minutum TaxID=569862 RepID=A0A243RTA9_9ACTN|nr:hypothetical protein CA984_10355 [Streptosporangium minutum]